MTTSNPKQTEIWYVNLDSTIGAEKNKSRPVVVISKNVLNSSDLRIVVPITERKDSHDKFIWMIPLKIDKQNNLTKDSSIDCMHIRSIDKKRFTNKIGKISPATLNDIKAILNIIT
ncbi:MAG: type II toxin-antitoxin system PemK/MazF family toxin [Rhodothermaceae bacterium]